MIETETAISGNKVMSTKEWKTHFATKKSEVVRVSNEFKHTFYEIKSDLKMFKEEKQHWKKVNSDTVKEFAVPRLIEEYLKQMVQFKKPIN